MIVLLDLNYTLVANSQATVNIRDWAQRIAQETYRLDLIAFCRPHHTILITVRRPEHEQATLAHLAALTGWQPDAWYFNPYRAKPPECKELPLVRDILPQHGPDQHYLAIESNDANAAMYQRHGILVVKCWGGQHRGSVGKVAQRDAPQQRLL